MILPGLLLVGIERNVILYYTIEYQCKLWSISRKYILAQAGSLKYIISILARYHKLLRLIIGAHSQNICRIHIKMNEFYVVCTYSENEKFK